MSESTRLLRLLFSFCFFFVLMGFCYTYMDRTFCDHITSVRVSYYIPLRILSILSSPATQLIIWTSLFVWFLIFKRSEKYVLIIYPIIASMILTNTVIRFIKVFFGRSRPDMYLTEGIYTLQFLSFERIYSSLPSGHAATIACIFAYLAAKQPKYSLLWISVSLALSLPRALIGAHFLSDILIGNYLGFLFTWLFYYQESLIEPAYLAYTRDNRKLGIRLAS